MGAVLDKNSLTWTVPSLLGRGEWLAIMKRWQNGIHCQESVFQFLLLKPAAPDPNHTMSACFPCYRVQEPDFNTAYDWPIEIIETIEPMQKLLENSCQSCKKSLFGKNIHLEKFDQYIQSISTIPVLRAAVRQDGGCVWQLWWLDHVSPPCIVTLPFIAWYCHTADVEGQIFPVFVIMILNTAVNSM